LIRLHDEPVHYIDKPLIHKIAFALKMDDITREQDDGTENVSIREKEIIVLDTKSFQGGDDVFSDIISRTWSGIKDGEIVTASMSKKLVTPLGLLAIWQPRR
jgi:hypothetical protein